MDDAPNTVHDKRRGGEFLLVFLTHEEVHALARLVRWQFGRNEQDVDAFTEALSASALASDRVMYEAALDVFRNEQDRLGVILREFRAAWRRPTVTDVS